MPGAGQRVVALLEPALVEQQPVARRGPPRPAAGRGSGPRSPAGRRRAPPSQAAEPVELRARGPQIRQPEVYVRARRPACAAPARRRAARPRVIWSGLSAASNIRALPSQLRKVPAFSATAATGRTTSARSVTSPGRSSSETRKPTSSSASRARAGSGRSATSTPATSSAPSSPVAAASTIWPVSRPKPAREFGQAPDARRPRPGPAGRWPDVRRAAATAARPPRPRRARRPGAGSTPAAAPVAAAARTAAVSPPGTAASRSPTTITAPSARSASAAVAPVVLQADPARERVQPLGLGAGRGGQQRAARLLQAAGGVRGQRERPLPVLAVGLAQPQEDAGRLLLGLEPGEQDRAAPSPARCT